MIKKNSYKIITILLLIIIISLIYGRNCYMFENFEINSQIPKVIYLSYKTKNIPEF